MNMNVLIVDDYTTMLRIIQNLLKQLGFKNIDEATDGTMAFEKVQQKDYGLIISDWNMVLWDTADIPTATSKPEGLILKK